jgi:putative ABC transport system permease protein
MTRAARARLWLRWGLRDARSRWLQVISIGLLLALGVGLYSAMSSMSSWRTASADASFSALRMHDLRVALTPGSYVTQGRLGTALTAIPDRSSVSAAEERLVVLTQVDASRGRTGIIVPGRLVGAPTSPAVDAIATVRGRARSAGDVGRPIVELERNFAKHYALPPAGTLRLTGGREVRYVGQALAPEYFVVTAPGAQFGAEAGFAVMFTSLLSAQTLSGERGKVNELVLRIRPGTSIALVQAELAGSLRRSLPGVGFTFTAGSQEPARRLLYKDAEGDQQMMNIFAALLLGAAAFAAFNLVSRTVEAQRREIGIGMALGVRPRALAARPLLLGAQVAVLGIALGVPAGLAANAWLRSVMQSLFPLPVLRTPMQLGVFVQGAGLGLAVSLLATAIPLRRALTVAPVEAIRVGARAAKSSGAAWITRGLRLPGGSLSGMPLRNVLRAPRRTLMTVLGIGAVVAITLALAGVIDSFNATLAASRAEALAGSRARLTVDLAAPQPESGTVVRAVTRAPGIGTSQPSLTLPVTLAAGRRHLDATFESVVPNGPVWHPTLSRGTLDATRAGLVIAKRAADDLHVGIGSSVAIRYPTPSGQGGYRLSTAALRVTGIHTSPLRFLTYTSPAGATALGLGGLVNRVSVIPALDEPRPMPNVRC